MSALDLAARGAIGSARTSVEAARNTTLLAAGPVPPGARGRWCVFATAGLERHSAVPYITLLGANGEELGSRWFLQDRPAFAGHGCWAVGHIAQAAARYSVVAMGRVPPGARTRLRIRPVSPALAALLLLGDSPAVTRRLLGSGGVKRTLAELATTRGRPSDYALWVRCFEPQLADLDPLDDDAPSLGALVFQPRAGAPEALAATVRSLGADVAHRIVTHEADWRTEAAALDGDYVAVLQAGEVLPPHATALAPAELERLGRPAIAVADVDELAETGERRAPQFRPEPNRALMLSGTLSRGLWLVRRDALLAHPAGTAPQGWAEVLRLDLALRCYEAAGELDARRIPYVLSHRRYDAAAAPAGRLAEVVDAHLRRSGSPLRAVGAFPLRTALRSPEAAWPGRIGVVVPSTLRTPHSLRRILGLLDGTGHRDVEMIVAVAQPGPLDPVQRDAAARIAADPRARVVCLPTRRFNFAEVNNRAVAMLGDGLVCLVNDDLVPLGPDWLDHMAAQLADPRVAVVGARLHYPDGSVQHGGVVMGVGGLCDHAGRHLTRGALGRAALTQEVSAVTAACMLVRRSAFAALGGFDERYPSAYNDVDFCLRAREAGHAVVYAAEAALVHHELQTYGSHYADDRAPFEAEEVAAMRRRWAAVIAADPFHNPNLDLAPGREWCLAFPPRPPADLPWPAPP